MNAIPRPLLQALALVAGIGILVLGTFCAWQNSINKNPVKPPHYVLIEETYRSSVMHIYKAKAKVLEELDGCYKIKIIDFYYKCIQPDEIWILKSGKDSGEFHLIWDSAPAPATVPYPETIICSTGTFKSNGGTLPTSHNY